MGNVYAYVRVSAKDQNEDRQLISMGEMNVPESNTYVDKISGKDFERPQYKKMLRKIKPGDLIYIKSIDRLGRNYKEIIEQWKIITKDKGADICILDMNLLDTRRNKDLLGTFISDLVLALFSYVAENERITIRKRQAEGIAAAKAKGIKFGRKSRPLPANFHDVYQKWKNRLITVDQAAEETGMTRSTFYYQAKLFQNTTYSNE